MDQDGLKPSAHLLASLARPEDPRIVVIAKSSRDKSQVRSRYLWFKKAASLLDLLGFSTDKLRSATQSCKASKCSIGVAIWVRPIANAIVMAVGYKSSPEFRRPVIMHSKKVASNRTSREPTKNNPRSVATIVLAGIGYSRMQIVQRWNRIVVRCVSPPLNCDIGTSRV